VTRITYRNMVKTNYLKDPHGYPMRSHDLLAAFGLPPNAPIPPDYAAERQIGEVLVTIVPAWYRTQRDAYLPDGRRLPKRRVLAECPRCHTLVCAGHLHQHVGQRTCVQAQARPADPAPPRGWDKVEGGEEDL
jgi:hypothetical protein